MRPIGLGESVTGLCSKHVLAFPSDRLTHILPLVGHHKSTIITNDTHVLGLLLRSNQADSMSYKNIITMSVGLMAHVSSIGNIRDLISFRLTTADQTGGEVQAGKLACMDEHHYLAARA